MRLSQGVEWALHCCVSLTQAAEPVPAARLAELHGVPTAYLAKQLQALSRAGVIHSIPGQMGGYVLTQPPSAITALQIVVAIEGDVPVFQCTEIRQNGPLGVDPAKCSKRCAIARAMATAEHAWREALAEISIADLVAGIDADSSNTAIDGLRRWLATG
ncbi:Rrf2 family transcriptional regulator [uncultured Nitratireductor sp.]|uniref:RrF2 family transcriptional regulator n=1 Tax=uncultured Nitratireductor sp. TaxID=520953 RepID=UPI0025D88652|nr:Rrf2 family transcriptional regulator [uncultured Nitratireductor sp.]